jgi:redox-sensitive bicupin YhaK (pirin superfamily)
VQLWVNLPASLKFTPPRYQAITGDDLVLLTSDDGGALVRLIAGDLAGHEGPGVTHTPITYAHVTLPPGGQLAVPWNPAFNAMVYALLGQGYAGPDDRPFREHELVMFGPGDTITLRAAERQEGESANLELLLLGGLPIREPIAHYGPFVMNNKAQIIAALEDYQAGRMGVIPAADLSAS